MKTKIETLLCSGKNIFSINDICLYWGETNPDLLRSAIRYYVNKGSLHRVKRGFYSLNAEFDKFELAQKLIMPSYISLETALQFHGIIFQVTRSIQSVAPYSRKFLIKEIHYKYHKIKDDILINPAGILSEENFLIASPERAITDTLYLYSDYYFDNMNGVDIEKLKEISYIYNENTLQKKVDKLIDNIKNDA